MKNKLVSLLLCLCMLMGAVAFAEEAPAEPSAVTELTADMVLATLNGDELTWADVEPMYTALASQYSSYYDLSQQTNVDLFRAVAVENAIVQKLLFQKAAEMGVAELTAEENAALEEQASAEWEAAMADYIAYFNPDLTEESSDEDKAAARADAEAYYGEMGYTQAALIEDYKEYAVLDKVQALMVQDAVVTDEEVQAHYQSLVDADKALYENDLAAYVDYQANAQMMAMYASMYGTASEYDAAWYKPAGFRAVKHILLPVDEALMTAYTDLQARLEEQNAHEGEENAEPAEGEEAAEPVTEAMVNEAKAAILASLADKIAEIDQKVAEGVDFDELIAAYALNADGTPSDPGMVNGDSAVNGYEVCEFSTAIYVPEFVEAAMSIDEVGGVSAPYLSSFGVHIVKYIADVPGGPVALSEAERTSMYEDLLYEKQNALYNQSLEAWMAEAEIVYSGIVPSYDELMAAEAADAAAE